MKRNQLIILLVSLVIVASMGIFLYRALPPRSFTILTGSEQGEYYRTATLYAEIAKQKGFKLNLQTTAGSLDVLEMLQGGDASIGFVQGGIGADVETTDLSTVASVFREPVWIFYRKDLEEATGPLTRLAELEGMKVAVGADGSGTQPLAKALLGANGIDDQTATLLPLSSSDAVEGLADGTIDAMFVVVGPRSQTVQNLIRSPHVELMNLERADAYRSHFLYLSSITLPAGAIDLNAGIPAEDKKMVSTVANLVMRNDLHPDLLRLMVLAAIETHRSGGLFEVRNEFPNLDYPDYPVKQEVQAYLARLRSGESTLDNRLPFWLAALIDRYLLFFLPALLVILPVLGRSPLLYRLIVRRRITRWYRDVRRIDQALKTMTRAEVDENIEFLDELETQLDEQLKVADAFMPDVYNLKMHLDMVQQKLQRRQSSIGQGNPA